MDWSKAKTILILTFLLLDLFLGYQIIHSYNRDRAGMPQGELIPSSMEELLQSRHIKLAVDIPAGTPEMYYLYVRFTGFTGHMAKLTGQSETESQGNGVIVTFDGPLLVPNSEDRMDLLKFMEPYIPFSSDYLYDTRSSSTYTAHYVQTYQRYPLFSVPMDIRMKGSRVFGYSQTHVQIISQGNGRRVIPALTAVRTLLDNGYIRYGESISDISIGYYGHMYDADIQVLAPVWRIIHTNGMQYVNGITGAIEQIPVLEKK
ncbi:regulatory protein YycI of two-component signal transduction system YycFG [Aneurinibacillus soli]|uniref:YycH protein n=1 Tax=Aneurinibacillus soli TaxID=1500254 RepID=A0A0U5B650_9BACL|nr:two-component system regulatory protein YycI [Aneurinibacillus soli]PYE61265.1 regulatory protein YycI of two-component signal transduction system YycFG [Aneurinibacillus soli]BAU26301.1 YycH protein [Aneurinibacillus soli]